MNNKRPKIISACGSYPSAKSIRDAIEEITGVHYFIVNGNKPYRGDILFRYGNSREIVGFDPNLNSNEFINLCRNKLTFSQFCQQHNIYSPVYHRINEVPNVFPVLVRQTLTSFGGKGIFVCDNIHAFNATMRRNDYWTPFIKCEFELRVHLFDNQVNRIYKKVNQNGDENAYPIRNHIGGYHFSLRNNDAYPKVLELAQNIGNLFMEVGGHFSAIDIGWDKLNQRYFIFESNSAPGLNSVNAIEYANFIIGKGKE
jgi:glutathione synthase/RimK-type ligase-like ATP-grasp enzyme